jgi:hypothetical protein
MALAWLAGTKLVRSLVANLVYPTVVRCLKAEFQPDCPSSSGLAEEIAWKSHAYNVLVEELAPNGLDLSADGMRSDQETRARLFARVLDCIADVKGDILEFGVYNGESLLMFADRCNDRQVFGFDTFEGLPTDWWTRPAGTFKNTTPIPERPNLVLIKGLFDETIPNFLTGWCGHAALVHIDCDLYQSTISCLLPILPRCQVGSVILFDEYWNYPEFAKHEWLAWREVRGSLKVGASCIGYDGRRAAFRITQL